MKHSEGIGRRAEAASEEFAEVSQLFIYNIWRFLHLSI
jgi:hypothetical protein